MELRDFQERLRALRFIDHDEFAEAVKGARYTWPAFRDDPTGWLLIVEDVHAQAIWDHMEARLPPGKLAGPG